MTATQTTQTTQTAVAVEATKLDRIDFYACFTASKIFEDLLNAIPNPEVKKAIEQWGIGDDLTLTEFGNYVYEYESGGLLEKPVREALEVLEALDEERDQERDGDWDSNYHAICEIAEAYAAFANANALQAAE